MKTIRNISLLTIVAVINFSCSDDPIDPINSSESFTGELSLTTDRSVVSLNVYGEDIPLGGNAQINLSGQGTSDSDLMPQMSFEGSHKESYDWTSKSSIIKEGEFVSGKITAFTIVKCFSWSTLKRNASVVILG